MAVTSIKTRKNLCYFLFIFGCFVANIQTVNAQTDWAKQTYVLVHGAWHGGWCWQEVSENLREEDKIVYTPTLSGLGEHRNTLDKNIDLNTHIQDIINVIEMEDLTDVTLVGHSYAGLVIAGVADQIPERLKQLIFLDAVIVENGQSALSVQLPETQKYYKKKVVKIEGTRIVPIITAENFGVTGDEKLKWVDQRLTAQPYKTFTQALRLQNEFGNDLPLTYIACSSPELEVLKPMVEKIKKNDQWTFFNLDSGHDAMVIVPNKVSQLLLQLNQKKRLP